MKKLAVALMTTLAVMAASVSESRADGTLILGTLACHKTGPGQTYLIFSTHPVRCTYEGVGGPQAYAGTSGIALGVDLDFGQQAGMAYLVMGGSSVAKDSLVGTFVGGKASATVGLGLSAQAGLAGAGNNFTLVPFGLGGQAMGFGASAGIGYLQLKSAAAPAPMAAPAAAPTPAPAPAARPAPRGYLVFFDWDKADLTAEAKRVLATVAEDAKRGNVVRIRATGHADRSGPDAYNMKLSLRRAVAVKGELVRLGLSEKDIAVVAKGETEPLVPTADGVREPQNRRVETVFQ